MNILKKIAKSLYSFIPFKKYLFLLIKSIYIPSQNVYQHLTFRGIFKVFSGTNSFKMIHTETIIENQLFWKGLDGFEPESLKLWARMSKNADIIFDLGANSGIFSLISKSENPDSKVYAFECVERVFKVLERNISINNYDVSCYMQAVSNKDGAGYFFDDDAAFTNSVTVNLGMAETAAARSGQKGVESNKLHKVVTELITLDTFIEQNNIQKIDLMKIDVETHEPEVFEGFKKHLKVFRPTLLVEILRDYVASSLEKEFADLGYIFFYINEPFGGRDYEVEGEIYQKVDTLIGGNFGNYLVCSPEKAQELNLI